MLYYRQELNGGVLFDTSNMSFSLVKDKPTNFDGTVIPLQKRLARSDILSAPIAVYYELLNACNLKCRHCFACATGRGGQRLNTGDSLRLVAHLKEIGVINLRVTGGEPTVHPDWYGILKEAKRTGLVVSLQTNGVFSDVAETVAKIASLDLDQLSVSFDGPREVHDWLRGNGSHKRLFEGVEALCAAGVIPRFNTILHKRNLKHLNYIFETVSRYGKVLNLFFLRPVGRALKNRELLLGYDEHLAAGQQIEELAKHYPGLQVFHSAAHAIKRGQTGHMPFGKTVLCVTHDGTVWPLQYLRYQSMRLSAGRFPDQGIDELWMKSEVLESYRKWQVELRERCLRCAFYCSPCPGVDPEIEIAVQLGQLPKNPICKNENKVPYLKLEKQIATNDKIKEQREE